MAKHIRPDGSFYDQVWRRNLDDLFLQQLDFHASLECRRLTLFDGVILSGVCKDLNKCTTHLITYDDVVTRFELAIERYKTWSSIIGHPEVIYHPKSFTVTTSAHVWAKICKDHELGVVYFKDPQEIMWDELQGIFGPDVARGEDMCRKRLKKPQRNSDIYLPDGTKKLTLDEVLQITDFRKDMMPKHGRNTLDSDEGNSYIPSDAMSTTKGPAHGKPLPRRPVASVEYNKASPSSDHSSGSNPVAKRFLQF